MRITLTALIVLVLSARISADDKETARQKAIVDENAKKLKLKIATIIETNDLIVCASLPETKAKVLAESAQKAVYLAKENLEIAKNDELFKGKLMLYAFADHTDLKTFIRQVEQRRPEQDVYSHNFRGDAHVAVSPDPGGKLVEAELITAAASWAGAAVLNKKIGYTAESNMPEWLQIGYGRACALRSEAEARQFTIRSKIKSLVTAKGKMQVASMELWNGGRLAERDIIAGSFVEYLAFGPLSKKFVGFARLTKPSMINDNPIEAAIASLETTPENLDYAWKTWVVKGK